MEKFAAGSWRSGDAFAAVGLIVGVMGLAHQIAAFFREKLIIDPIHRDRYMAAAIHVGVKLPLVIDQKAFFIGASNRQQEFCRFAWLQLVGERDFVPNPRMRTLCLASSAVSIGSRLAMAIFACHREESVDERTVAVQRREKGQAGKKREYRQETRTAGSLRVAAIMVSVFLLA